MNNTICPITFR